MLDVMPISLWMSSGASMRLALFWTRSHVLTSCFRSRRSSRSPFPEASVRTMMPNPSGLISRPRSFKRRFSAQLVIFRETPTLSPSGTRTMNRPAREGTAVTLGPLVPMGSFLT